MTRLACIIAGLLGFAYTASAAQPKTIVVDWVAKPYDDLPVEVGDTIEFVFGFHSLLLFDSKSAYDSCDYGASEVLAGVNFNRGETDDGRNHYFYEVTSVPVYFGCDVGNHCATDGQKIKLIGGDFNTVEVGGDDGWQQQTYEPVTAEIGDQISFTLQGTHSVVVFEDKTAFDRCDFSRSETVYPSSNGGDYVHTVESLPLYFGCSVGQHCAASGQKIEVYPVEPETEPNVISLGGWAVQSYEPVSARPGDIIEFDYGTHTVFLFDSLTAYDLCLFQQNSYMLAGSDYNAATSPDGLNHYRYVVPETLPVYIGCDIPFAHCLAGQKVMIVDADRVDSADKYLDSRPGVQTQSSAAMRTFHAHTLYTVAASAMMLAGLLSL